MNKYDNKNKSKFGIAGWMLLIAVLAVGAKITDNNLKLGTTGQDSQIDMSGGDGAIRYNNTIDKVQFSNDGVSFTDIGAGGGGAGSVGSENLIPSTSSTCDEDTGDWTASGGVLAQETSVQGFGAGSCKWDASAAAQTLDHDSTFTPVKAGMAGRNCVAQMSYTWVGTPGDLAMQVQEDTDGLKVAVDLTPTASGVWRKDSISWPCEAGESYKFRITATTNAAEIIYDEVHLGNDIREIEISQSSHVVTWQFATTAACASAAWSTGTLATSSTDTDCPGPTIILNSGVGVPQTTDEDQLKVTINNLPAGHYKVEIDASLLSSAALDGCFAISDGTDTRGRACGTQATGNGGYVSITADFTYSASGNRTFDLFGSVSASSTTWFNATNNAAAEVRIYRFPTAVEIARLIDNDALTRVLKVRHFVNNNTTCQWDVDSITFADSATSDADCLFETMKNTNMGTVVSRSAANNLPGILWTPPKAGTYLLCMSASVGHATNGAQLAYRVFENNSSTDLGGHGFQNGNSNLAGIVQMCAPITVNSVTEQDLRLQLTEESAGSAIIRVIGVQAATGKQGVIEWTIIPISESGPVVTSTTQNPLVIEFTVIGAHI